MVLNDEQPPAPLASPSEAILVLAVEIRWIARENALPVAEAAAALLIAAMLRDLGRGGERRKGLPPG